MEKLSRFLLGVGLAALLAGCGGSDNGSDENDGSGGGSTTKTFTIRSSFPGMTVSLHDPDQHFKRLKTKRTGSDGSASFEVESDTVTASVSYSTQIEMTSDLLFKVTKPLVVYFAYSNCEWNRDLNMSECDSANWCAIQQNNTYVPAWIMDAAFSGSSEYNITATNSDTNGDGQVSIDEFYEVLKNVYDKDNNDAITLQEFWRRDNNISVATRLYVNVPARTYDFSIMGGRYYYGGSMCHEDSEVIQFDLNLTHTENIKSVDVSGSSWDWIHNDDDNSTISEKVNIGFPDSHGKYDYLFVMKDENNTAVHIEALLDQTQGDMRDGVTYDITTLGTPTMRDVTVNKDVNNSNLRIRSTYNGLNLGYGGTIVDEDNVSVLKKYYNDKFTYSLSGNANKKDGNVEYRYSHGNGYYGDGTLKSIYKISDYPMLDVTVSFAGNGVVFSGSDIGKIDKSELGVSSRFANGTSYDIEVRGTGTLQIDGNDIKPANLLPSTLSNLMSGDQNITGMFASAVEDRAHDGRDMFSKGFEGYGPYRRVDAEKFFETGGSGASMRRAKVFGAAKKTGPRKSKQNEKVKPIDNPFVIVLGTKPLVK